MSFTHPASVAPEVDAVRNILRQVYDPEVGMNIVDLGLVYRIESTPERLALDMTMTSPACPMGEMIIEEVRAALADELPASRQTEVRLVWDPPWTPSMMSEAGRSHFGW